MGRCVFWYPVIYHSPLNERFRRFETEQCVSDFGSATAFLKISILKKKNEASIKDAQKDCKLIERPITIECYKKESDGTQTPIFTSFKLTYKNHSRNGMVVYEYDEPKDYPKEKATRPFEEFFKEVCYHHVKSLFHNHEVQSDRDSGLKAYIAQGDFDINSIKDNNNEALCYYLKQYESVFSEYAEMISGRLEKHDAINLKFKDRLGLRDDSGGMQSYVDLVQYGWKEFKQWYNDPQKKDEVKTLKKDILKYSLLLHPHKNKISYELKSYGERLKIILDRNGKKENVKPEVKELEKSKIDAINEYYQRQVKRLKDQPNLRFYRYELEPLNTLLNNTEIDLGIYKPVFNPLYYCMPRVYAHRCLKNLIRNNAKLTKETRKEICKLCEGASTEYVYCKTLLESRYNWKIKKDNYNEEELDDRRTALNIRNAIRYIETAKYRCSNSQTDSTHLILNNADRVSKVAMGIAWISLIASLISLILAIWNPSNKSKEEPNATPAKTMESTTKCDTVLQDNTLNHILELKDRYGDRGTQPKDAIVFPYF